MFTTLPDVPTAGGNLIMTIIAELFKTVEVQAATDLYINVDGASDNINYHVMYGLAVLLRWCKQAGWRLTRIHILRFKVCILRYTHAHIYLMIPNIAYPLGGTHSQAAGWYFRIALAACVRQTTFKYDCP